MHASIWVFGSANLSTTLAPFNEEVDGAPPSCAEFNDLTDSLQKEWEDPTPVIEAIVDPSGKALAHIWDPAYLKPIDPILQVELDEIDCIVKDSRDKWRMRAAVDKKIKEKYAYTQCRFKDGKLITIGTTLPEGYQIVVVPAKALYPKFKDYCVDYSGYVHDVDTNRYGYWYNPNGRWDWWVVGGRWANSFPLKKDILPQIIGDAPSDLSVFESIAVDKGESTVEKLRPKDRSDYCRATDIDWGKLYTDIRERYTYYYTRFHEFDKGKKDRLLELVALYNQVVEKEQKRLEDADRTELSTLIKELFELGDTWGEFFLISHITYLKSGVGLEEFTDFGIAKDVAPVSIVSKQGEWLDGPTYSNWSGTVKPEDTLKWWGVVSDHIRLAETSNDEEGKLIAAVDIHY